MRAAGKIMQKKGSNKGDTALSSSNSVTGDDSAPVTVPSKRFLSLSLGVALSLFLTLVDSSIVATSLYTIGVEFEAAKAVNWVALAYTLAYLGCAVTFARFSDIFGRRNVFLTGQIMFMAFSIGCGFSQNLSQLIALRVLQGVGGSGIYSLSMVILPELCPPQLLGYMGSLIGIILAGSGVLGPVLGGILTYYASWRWVFWINGPIGALSLIIFWFAWPRPENLPPLERRHWSELDALGSLLILAAAVLVVFAFQNAGENPEFAWEQAVFIAPLLLGLGGWVALIAWEAFALRKFGDKIALTFPVDLFENRAYAGAALTTLLLGFPYLLLVYSLPLRSQIVSGKSALMAGVMLLPMLGSTAVGSMIGGNVNSKKNFLFETLLVGSALLTLSCGLLTMIDGTEDDAKSLGFIVFAGVGFGLATTAATIIPTLEAPIKDYAPSQGILSQLRILGGSLGISGSTVLAQAQLKTQIGTLSYKELQSLGHSDNNLSETQFEAVRQAYSKAFRLGMIAAAAASGAALIVSVFTIRRPRQMVQEQRTLRTAEETARRAQRPLNN